MNITTGKQENFLDAMKDLLELEQDTKALYEQAIGKIENDDCKANLNEFKEDHATHIQKLSELLNKKEQTSTMGSVIRPLMDTIKLEFASLIGDRAKLSSILNNEIDIKKVYERLNARHDRWEDAKELLKQALQDEKKHKDWLEKTIQ